MFCEFLYQFKWYRQAIGGKWTLVSVLDKYAYFWVKGEPINDYQEEEETEEYLGLRAYLHSIWSEVRQIAEKYLIVW
jgi:hypothetical protein